VSKEIACTLRHVGKHHVHFQGSFLKQNFYTIHDKAIRGTQKAACISIKKINVLLLLREVIALSRNIGNACVGTVMHNFLILN